MSAANPARSRWKSLPKLVRGALCVSLTLSAGNASAVLRLGELWPSHEYDLSSASDPKARCRTSSLTQEKFLELVHAIVEHGDLTDKAYIEITLQIKFGPEEKEYAFSHIPGGGYYNADMPGDIPDAPIYVGLDIGTVDINKALKRELSSGVGFDHLDRVGAVFHNCQYLTRKQIDPKSEAIVHHHDTVLEYDHKLNKAVAKKVPERSLVATWDLGKVATNGADVEITYTFKTDGSDAIENVDIDQKSETRPNPIGEDNGGHP